MKTLQRGKKLPRMWARGLEEGGQPSLLLLDTVTWQIIACLFGTLMKAHKYLLRKRETSLFPQQFSNRNNLGPIVTSLK